MSFNRLSIATALLAVVAAGVVPLASASAGPSRSATTYRVTMKISTTRAVANEDTVTLTGTVSPAAPGTKVKVQVRYDGQTTWRKAGSAKVKKNSTYTFSFTPTTRQDRTYRVVKPGDDHAEADTSRERTLQAIGWVWLSSLTPSRTQDVAAISTMPINGESYGHTLYTGVDTTTGFVEYTLGRHAYKLQATYGLSDRTETGGQGHHRRDDRRRSVVLPDLRPRPVRAPDDERHRRLSDPDRLQPDRRHPRDRAVCRSRAGADGLIARLGRP